MSVWKTACYRDDALQSVCRHLLPADLGSEYVLSLADFSIPDCPDFELPGKVKGGNLAAQLDSDGRVLSEIISFAPRRDPDSAAFAKLAKTLGPSKFGVHGVYHFLADHWDQIFRPATLALEQAEFSKNLFELGYAASYRTAKEAKDKAQTSVASYSKYVLNAKNCIRELVKIGTRAAGKQYRREIHYAAFSKESYPEVPGTKPYWLTQYDIYWWKSNLILSNPARQKVYTFTRNDIERIDKVVMGLAWSTFYCAEYTAGIESVNQRLTLANSQMMALIRKSFADVSKERANELCRAYDVLLWLYVAEISQDVDAGALHRQKEKVRREDLASLVNVERFLGIARTFRMREALELLQIYKCLPQPDFDYFGAAQRQKDLYAIKKPYGTAVEDEDTGPYDDLWKYFRHTLLRAYHKKHGVCPGTVKGSSSGSGWKASYPHISPDKVPYTSVDEIDMANTFRYGAHGMDILDLVKDKAICPVSIRHVKDDNGLFDMDVSRKNYLMDVLSRGNPIDMQDLIRNHGDLMEEIKAEDKPEAKKPNGRWFFEAGTDRRLVHSEYETSVAEYAKNTTGCMLGRSTRDKIAAMNYVCSPDKFEGEGITKPVLVSFDLEKFSPAMQMETHERGDAIFAEVFGQEHIRHASDVFKKGNVHYIKRKVHHQFPKPARDFEGFSGRKHTLYHCAVMGYTVRRLRDLRLLDRGARFASFVDDGLLRLEVRAEGFDENVKRIFEVIEKVYNMANLYVSWDKTYVSSRFAVFLNEFYYNGTPVTPGIRSFLKITTRGENICPSFLDDLAMLDSTVRGAIAAGCPTHTAYAGYVFNVMDLFAKWGKGREKYRTSLALAAFSPVALGGFGICSVLNLSGSMSGPTLVESIGYLRAIAVRFRNLVPAINKIVNVPMREMNDEAKIASPLGARRQGRILKATRGKAVIERKLQYLLDTPVIRTLIGGIDVRVDPVTVAHLTASSGVPVEVIGLVTNSSIAHSVQQLGAKFLRARTAFKLVPPRAFFRASIANMTEARELIAEWSY